MLKEAKKMSSDSQEMNTVAAEPSSQETVVPRHASNTSKCMNELNLTTEDNDKQSLIRYCKFVVVKPKVAFGKYKIIPYNSHLNSFISLLGPYLCPTLFQLSRMHRQLRRKGNPLVHDVAARQIDVSNV